MAAPLRAAGKLPIPRLPVPRPPPPAPGKRRKKTVEERREDKRLKDHLRAQSRINIGRALHRWRALRGKLGLTLDQELAVALLDSYERLNKASSSEKPTREAPRSPSPRLQQNHDETKVEVCKTETQEQPVTPRPPFGSETNHRCPSCGFVFSQWKLKDENSAEEEHQPESIEVILELEQRDESVSGGEECEGQNDDFKEESEGSGADDEHGRKQSSDEDWNPKQHQSTALEERESDATEDAASSDEDGAQAEFKRFKKQKLCVECGVFYRTNRHECSHKRPIACNICGKRFTLDSALKLHSRIHTESYEHPCKFCHANFKTKLDKLAHETIHQKRKDPYSCPDCSATFSTFRQRKEHLMTHKKKNLQCAVCGLVLAQRSCFLRHAVVHSGERAFKCPVCEHSFNQEGHLKSHMRLHTGERPYSCQLCDKSFNHNVSLKSHVQRHHSTEPDDRSRGTNEAEAETNGNDKAKGRKYYTPTGRPKGRPKRNAAKKRKPSEAMEDGDDESE